MPKGKLNRATHLATVQVSAASGHNWHALKPGWKIGVDAIRVRPVFIDPKSGIAIIQTMTAQP
jgi:hypothetical protein